MIGTMGGNCERSHAAVRRRHYSASVEYVSNSGQAFVGVQRRGWRGEGAVEDASDGSSRIFVVHLFSPFPVKCGAYSF